MQCQICQSSATVHLTEIVNGQKTERHLCEECAQKEGISIKSHVPIGQLLNNIVDTQQEVQKLAQNTCPNCGLSWQEFRKSGLLGCPNDYIVFEQLLSPIVQKAHEGAIEHKGRVPGTDSACVENKQLDLIKLKQDLQIAIEAEDYEAAAILRDEIRVVTEK